MCLSYTATFAQATTAQPIRWLTMEDGLAASSVTDLVQDARGFLWVNSPVGLARYDGQQVLTLGFEQGMGYTAWDQCLPDGAGGLWLRRGSEARHWIADSLLSPLPADAPPCTGLGSDQRGRPFFTGPASVQRWQDGALRNCDAPIGRRWQNPVYRGHDGQAIWLTDRFDSASHLIRWSDAETRSRPLTYDPLPDLPILNLGDKRVLYAAAEGLILSDSRMGERILIPAANGFRPAAESWPPGLRAWLLDDADRIWLAGEEAALQAYQLRRHAAWDSVALQPLAPLPLPEPASSLLQDREGNLWFGTPSHGAGFLPSNSSFVRNLSTQDGLPDNVVLALAAEQEQNIWCGFRGGQLGLVNFAGIGGMGMPIFGSAGIRSVCCLVELPDGDMLAGTEEGLYRSRFRVVQPFGPLAKVRAMAVSPDGKLYIAANERVYGIPLDALDQFAAARRAADLPDHWVIGNRAAVALAIHPERGCWYAAADGIYRYDGFETVHFTEPKNLAPASISDLAAWGKNLVIATRGYGVHFIPALAGGLDHLEQADGLASNLCNDLFVAGDSVLWVAGNRGLTRFGPSAEGPWQTQVYGMQDGLASNEINAVMVLRGTCYLGTNRGLSLFGVSDLVRQPIPPGIYLTGISINDRDTAMAESYRLSHRQNRLGVRFQGIAPGQGHRIAYRYRMEGLDDAWHATGAREVRFASLGPGDYRFTVEAHGPDGEAGLPVGFTLHIDKPWYATIWFVVLAILLGLMLATAIYAALLGRQEKRNLQHAVSSKTLALDAKIRELRHSNDELEQFAYIASHDLKEPLRNIANYVQLIERHSNGQLEPNTREYLGFAVTGVKRMYAMIDGLLAYSGLTRSAGEARDVDLDRVLEGILDQLPAKQRARVSHLRLPAVWGDPVQVRLLLDHLIDNALKFNPSPDARVSIEAEVFNDEVEIRVHDNGRGLDERYADKVFQLFERIGDDPDHEGSGIGLALCKKIAERHGGRIWYRTSPEGTTFYVTLKAAPDAWEPASK